MNAEFKPISLEDLKLSPEEAKLIDVGAKVFMPVEDPRDNERFLDTAKP